MYTKTIILFTCIMAIFCHKAASQDSLALETEFKKLLSFSDQPYLYYTNITSVSSEPVLQPEDTVKVAGIFYKNRDTVYYQSGDEEMYIQGDLVFRVNAKRNTIWISSVAAPGVAAKPAIAGSAQMLQQLGKKYAISKTNSATGNTIIRFEARPDPLSKMEKNTTMSLEYSPANNLPQRLDFVMRIKEYAGEDLQHALQNEGINLNTVLQQEGGNRYFVRVQKMSIVFTTVFNTADKVAAMPVWSDKIAYNKATGEFTGKGSYSGYEISKLF